MTHLCHDSLSMGHAAPQQFAEPHADDVAVAYVIEEEAVVWGPAGHEQGPTQPEPCNTQALILRVQGHTPSYYYLLGPLLTRGPQSRNRPS
jgi:hypothetical protein